jgi:hypothetical protein
MFCCPLVHWDNVGSLSVLLLRSSSFDQVVSPTLWSTLFEAALPLSDAGSPEKVCATHVFCFFRNPHSHYRYYTGSSERYTCAGRLVRHGHCCRPRYRTSRLTWRQEPRRGHAIFQGRIPKGNTYIYLTSEAVVVKLVLKIKSQVRWNAAAALSSFLRRPLSATGLEHEDEEDELLLSLASALRSDSNLKVRKAVAAALSDWASSFAAATASASASAGTKSVRLASLSRQLVDSVREARVCLAKERDSLGFKEAAHADALEEQVTCLSLLFSL